VWLSNQIGNTGVLTGFEQLTTPPRGHSTPTRIATSRPLEHHGCARLELRAGPHGHNFKFPQVWRSNLRVDKRLPWWGLVGTLRAFTAAT
jgi:hypothetical protein